MRTLADGLRAAHARRQHHMVEGYARLHLVPPAHQVSALVQLKQLELVDLQRRVRHDVLVERRVMQVWLFVYVYTGMCVCVSVCVYRDVCLCVCTGMYVCMYIYRDVCLCLLTSSQQHPPTGLHPNNPP